MLLSEAGFPLIVCEVDETVDPVGVLGVAEDVVLEELGVVSGVGEGVKNDVESTACSDWVTSGRPCGSTKVIAGCV